MKKVLSLILILMLIFTLCACGNSDKPVSENDNEGNDISSENAINCTIENDYVAFRFYDQEVVDGYTYLYYTIENKTGEDVYAWYNGVRELADPSKKGCLGFEHSEVVNGELEVQINLFNTADRAADDLFGQNSILLKVDDKGTVTDAVFGDCYYPQHFDNSGGVNAHERAEYAVICDYDRIVVTGWREPRQYDDGVSVIVDIKNNSNYEIIYTRPGESASLDLHSKNAVKLDDMKVGDQIELDFPVATIEGSDGKGGGQFVEGIHLYLKRVK
ncbi:MAG: hypothetical protein MJ171_03590 [Clostridia bacterium]|nr:hypothetical protein [Clostridia bacterium]